MNTLLGYQYALVLAAHSLCAADAHVAEEFVLGEAAQASGRLVSGREHLAFDWSNPGIQHVLKGTSPPRGQLTAAVFSPVAALLLGVAAALYQLHHKKQFQAVAQGGTAGAGGHNEAGVTAPHTCSDYKDVGAIPEEALETRKKSGQEDVHCPKMFNTLASVAASARQSVVACMMRICDHNRKRVDGTMSPTTGNVPGSISSSSTAGSHMSKLQVEVPTTDNLVNSKDPHVASFSCQTTTTTTTAASASTSASSTQCSSSGQLHNLKAGSLCAAPSTGGSRRPSETFSVPHSYHSVTPSSSNSSHNLEQAIRRGLFVTAEGHPDMSSITKVLIDVAAGLSCLHSMGVVHGDLKPANVLLKSTTRGFRCKITEFGLSQVLGQEAMNVNSRIYGTLDYTAPEVLQEGGLTTAADIYSFGLIMWDLYTGTRVFGEGLSLGQIYCMVALHGWRPQVPENMPADYAALMQACWDADRLQRPTICKVLSELQKPSFSGEVTGYWEPWGFSAFVRARPHASGAATYCSSRQGQKGP